MASEESEGDDIGEIEEDGQSVGDHIEGIGDPLWESLEYASRGKTIVENDRQVEDYGDGQVEAHSVEKEEQSLAERGVVEKLKVEQIEQPTAQAKCQKTGQQPVNKQNGGR